jgi:phage host-nuclease inhibitor protein Gam
LPFVPRRKGESDADFIKRIHAKNERKQARELRAKARKQVKPEIKREVRREVKRVNTSFGKKAGPVRSKYRTTAFEVGNPFKGERIGRVRERVRA